MLHEQKQRVVMTDSRSILTLGPAYTNTRFLMHELADGSILLMPAGTIAASDLQREF